MERVMEGDQLVLVFVRRHRLADLASELYGGLVGLGAAVADEGAGGALKAPGRVRELDELLRQQTGVWIVVQIRRVHELSGLAEMSAFFFIFLLLYITCSNSTCDTPGSQCPSALTAIPAVRSRYFRFSMSHM